MPDPTAAPAAPAAAAPVSAPAAPAASPSAAPVSQPSSTPASSPASSPASIEAPAAPAAAPAAAQQKPEPKGSNYPQTEDGLAQFVREHDAWAEENPDAAAAAKPAVALPDEEPKAELVQEPKLGEEGEPAKAEEPAGPLPQELEAAFNADPALKAALDANPKAREMVMDMGRKYEAAKGVIEIVPTVDDARFMAEHANVVLDLRHNAMLGVESPEARQGFWSGLQQQFAETDEKGVPKVDAAGKPVMGKDYDLCLLTPAVNEKLGGKLAEMTAATAELEQKLKGYYPSEADKAADQKRLDDLRDNREAIGWVLELVKAEGGLVDEKLPPLPPDATPEQRKFQERLEREQAELRKQQGEAGKGSQLTATKAFENEQRIGWQTGVGDSLDKYLAEAKTRGEVIPDYMLQEKYIDPATKQATQFPRLAVNVLLDFDNAVMGITRERNEIQRLERMGPAGKQLREANAARLRQAYLPTIIQKHVREIQDGIRKSQDAEAARRGEIAKVARTEPQTAGAAPGGQANLSEAQLQEKAMELARKDPRWGAADGDERQMILMTARTTAKWG